MENVRRDQATERDIELALKTVQDAVGFRCKKEGFGTMASLQEIFGVLRFETIAMETPVSGRYDSTRLEGALTAIAVAATMGLVSVRRGVTRW